MENRRGSGIFLGVVGVATLVVAIIGATFAYFSASATADERVDLTAYEFNAEVTLTPVVVPTSKKLIPLLPEAALPTDLAEEATYDTNLLYAMNEVDCVDSKGNQVCAVYEVAVKNNGSQDLTLKGTLTTTKNAHPTSANKFVNLKYVSLDQEKGKAGTYEYGETLTAETLPDVGGTPLALKGMTVPVGETVKEYFVVYLEDTNETLDPETHPTNSQNSEMGAQYQGQITYEDLTSGSKLTGTFTLEG